MKKVVLLIGGNIGDRMSCINQAISLIDKHIGKITASSSLYETAAWGEENQAAFLNRVVCADTNKQAEEVMSTVLEIENKLGRIRNGKWQQRKIDIDILFYENEIIEQENLKIPHPHLHQRRFTLVPLVEVLPDFIHPKVNKTSTELLKKCEDTLSVKVFES